MKWIRLEGERKEELTKEQLKFDTDADSAMALIFLHLSNTLWSISLELGIRFKV
jgi:hypothetical protein